MKRTAFFVSDGTGITAEAIGHSLLSQFDKIELQMTTKPYINTVEKAQQLVQQVNEAAEKDGVRPLVFETIINQEISNTLKQCNGFIINIFSTFLSSLETELDTKATGSVGKTHSISNSYVDRIDAINFALDNDDGSRTRFYDRADIILIGASRTGKTPSCLYMAMQYGIRAANYPLTEEDLESRKLPEPLRDHKNKLFGLTIDVDRLVAIRNERRSNSKYASYAQCQYEIQEIEALFQRENIAFVNSTHFSVEEIAAKILATQNVTRRF
ncbi:kinase/pyrophosphorylase [Entomomonas sp. E2T0]|uniref:posphoenolpyruvate synthetase regulatory kinase/phosphorylase PpsR n=1 Tax=Entomomonas sp. E2T0 TaxID=2930213 RepID=UPI002228140D|nr:pyruvate, water dikinase regulatory protein [Entomomonas sp. E2T0]UYZ83228.1 kinase/pyrophosphorylase [Entomomonas sp. E2T0]